MAKTIGAAEFKAKCLRLINEMREDSEPITITERGQAVAVLSPSPQSEPKPPLMGALRGSVRGYDDPYQPAADQSDWATVQR